MDGRRAWIWGLMLTACVGPAGYRHPGVPGVAVVPEGQAGGGTLHRLDATREASDDELLHSFLLDAQQRGAAAVSRVTLHEVDARDGRAQDCSRFFAPMGQVETRMEAVMKASVPETRTVMRTVMRTEPQSEYRCHMVPRTVMRSETQWTMQYDSFTKSTRSVPVTRMVSHQEMQQECRSETTWRTVTRLEPTTELHIPPARMVWVPVSHVQWRLEENPPICVDANGAAEGRWVEGLLHVAGGAEKAEPREPAGR